MGRTIAAITIAICLQHGAAAFQLIHGNPNRLTSLRRSVYPVLELTDDELKESVRRKEERP